MSKELEEKIYSMSNSFLPLDMFYNDIRDNKAENYDKERAYKDLELIANFIIDLQSQLDHANEKLKGAIVAKFELGQEVFVFNWDGQISSGRIYEIQTNAVLHDRQPHITYLVDFTGNYSDDDQENDYYEEKEIYATPEEAEKKLQELRGGDFSGE